MSVTLHHIARYAAQKLASGPRAKEKATNAARVVVGEAKENARGEDRARAGLATVLFRPFDSELCDQGGRPWQAQVQPGHSSRE